PPPTSQPAPYTTLFRSTVTLWLLRPNHGEHRPPLHRRTLPSSDFYEKSKNGAVRFPAVDTRYCHSQKHPGQCSNMPIQEPARFADTFSFRSEEHTSELQSRFDLVCRLLLEKKNKNINIPTFNNEELCQLIIVCILLYL